MIRLRSGSGSAEELLAAIKDASLSSNDAYDRLKPAYDRLWTLGALKGYDKSRIRLFRLVMSSLSAIPLNELFLMLKVQIADDELHQDITEDDLERLGSNFLMKVGSTRSWRFSHESAREYIMREILVPVTVQKSDLGLPAPSDILAVTIRNHRTFVMLFLEIMESRTHHFHHFVDDSSETYIMRYGLRHCQMAAAKQNLRDEVWQSMIRRLLLNRESAFREYLATKRSTWLEYYDRALIPAGWTADTAWYATRQNIFPTARVDGLLTSHVLIWLDIVDVEDASMFERLLSQSGKSPEGLAFWAEAFSHSKLRNVFGRNAFHMACECNNVAVARIILRATLIFGGKDECYQLLTSQFQRRDWGSGLRQNYHGTFMAFCYMLVQLALESAKGLFSAVERRVELLLILLHYEDLCLRDGEGGMTCLARDCPYRSKTCSGRDTICCKTSQWSSGFLDHTALMFAVACKKIDEDTVCVLLRQSPHMRVDEQDKDGYTALHHAANANRLQVVSCLAEDCRAALDIRSRSGETALDVAVKASSGLVITYFTAWEDVAGPGPERRTLEWRRLLWRPSHRKLR